MKNTPSACFVILWFGPWPNWIDYFLHSCGRNPEFHWLIFHDCTEPLSCPDNVHLRSTTTKEIEDRVSDLLGIDFTLDYGYKACDLRPAYGLVFERELQGYTHWGWTDLDQIWGRIDTFLSSSRVTEHDILTAATHHLVGHCTLMRNTTEINRLFHGIPDFTDKLLSNDYEALEEKSFDQLVRAESSAGRLRLFEARIAEEDCWIHWSGRRHFSILWKNGTLRDLHTGRELCYFHFIQSKYRAEFQSKPPRTPLETFVISPNGIAQIRGARTVIHLLASVALGFATTLPFYAKSVAKRILPKDVRTRIRRKLSQRA